MSLRSVNIRLLLKIQVDRNISIDVILSPGQVESIDKVLNPKILVLYGCPNQK